MTTVITYGTFDLLHRGHLRLFTELRKLGDRLIVAVSTDEFNQLKGKKSIFRYEDRAALVSSLKMVDLVIPETDWSQKVRDIRQHNVDLFAMGSDWEGKFDDLNEFCEVRYLPRTPGVSSSELRAVLAGLDREHIEGMKQAIELLANVVKALD